MEQTMWEAIRSRPTCCLWQQSTLRGWGLTGGSGRGASLQPRPGSTKHEANSTGSGPVWPDLRRLQASSLQFAGKPEFHLAATLFDTWSSERGGGGGEGSALTFFAEHGEPKVDWNQVCAHAHEIFKHVRNTVPRLTQHPHSLSENTDSPPPAPTHRSGHVRTHVHTQKPRVRTPLLGGTRPLQSKLFHSGGLGISSVNRAAGLLSSLLLELILSQ